MAKKKITLLDLLIALAIIGIFAALMIPNVIVVTQRTKAKAAYIELKSIESDTQKLLNLISLSEQELGPNVFDLDYKEEILKSFPLVERFDKKSAFLFMSDEGKKKLKSIKDMLDEAIKEGRTIITREDAIIVKLDIMDTKINELGKKIINKWDVAVVIFYILGGFGVLLAILTFLRKFSRKEKTVNK